MKDPVSLAEGTAPALKTRCCYEQGHEEGHAHGIVGGAVVGEVCVGVKVGTVA